MLRCRRCEKLAWEIERAGMVGLAVAGMMEDRKVVMRAGNCVIFDSGRTGIGIGVSSWILDGCQY